MTAFADDLAEIGLTEEQFRIDLELRLADGIADMDQGRHAIICKSPIHGNGAFAAREIRADEYALVVKAYGQLTQEGAVVNHSREPNCELVHTPSGHLFLRSLSSIKIAEELTHDYRFAIWGPGP